MAVAISGIDKVLGNLNRQIIVIQGKGRQGLKTAGLLVEGESKAMTPVETGNLRAGAYTQDIGDLGNPGVEIGYTAAYAVFVHERTELRHPVGQAKFLETALKRLEKQIVEIIKKTAKI